MTTMNIHQAKTQLSRLLARVAKGEEVVIANAGRPVARLVPFEPSAPRREFGHDRGKLTIPKDFDAPLSDRLLRTFEE